jgi:Flp pilus assembly protein TadG
MVLATPALLTLVMLIVQTGLWLHAAHLVHAAAQEGARAARVETGTATAGRTRTETFLDRLAAGVLTDRHVTATRSAEEARIEISGHVIPVVPGMRLPVRAVAQAPVERFDAP